jgi:hypothetical protein
VESLPDYTGLVEFEVLAAVVMKSTVVWDITPCSPLKVNLRFRGTYVPLKHWRYIPEDSTHFIGLPSSLHILLAVVTKCISTEQHNLTGQGKSTLGHIILFNFMLLLIPTWQPHKSVKWRLQCMILPALNIGFEKLTC